MPDEYEFVLDEDVVPPLRGTRYEAEGLMNDMDVCVFTNSKDSLPWIGRIVKVYPGSKE